MRILILSTVELTKLGGVVTAVRTLGHGLKEAGDQVTYCKPGYVGPATAQLDGIEFHRLPMRSFRNPTHPIRSPLAFSLLLPATLIRLVLLIHRRKIQIVNVHYFDDRCWYLVLLQRLLRFRLVVSVHGADVQGPMAERHRRLLRRWHSSIDRVVYAAHRFRDEVLPSDCVLRESSVVIPYGIEIDGRIGRPLSERQNRIVCVAHLFERKGIDVLVDAFASLVTRYPSLTLDLVGDGPARGALEARVASRGLANRVHFHGAIPRARALDLIATARVFCLPSRVEPFGIVLAEAMALRTPIVATRVGGIPEVIRDGRDGLLVPVEDPSALASALTSVLDSPAMCRHLTTAAWERWNESMRSVHLVESYRALFHQVIDGDHGRA